MQWNQLTTTSSIIQDVGISNLPNLLTSSTPKIKIRLYNNNSNTNHSLLQTKIQFLTNCPIKGDPIDRWLFIKQSQINTIKDEGSYTVVFIMKDSNIKNKQYYSDNVIYVHEFSEVVDIINMSKVSLRRRLKLQNMVSRSQNNLQNRQSQNKLKQIANAVLSQYKSKNIKILTKLMNLTANKRKNMLKKYYQVWVISHLQNTINKQQEQLVSKQYLIEKSNKNMMKKCFNGWVHYIASKYQ